jgi:hypothetical protein
MVSTDFFVVGLGPRNRSKAGRFFLNRTVRPLVIQGQAIRVLGRGSSMPAPGNEVRYHHDQRNEQQEMDYSPHGEAGDETEQPEKDEDYRNGV